MYDSQSYIMLNQGRGLKLEMGVGPYALWDWAWGYCYTRAWGSNYYIWAWGSNY